ncbi:MAG: phospholipase D-like domain-containing protein [Vicinamibacteria bacterium]|nr:phospholipase D-like domain-containing protein [Vicinamibacteria bacterium]
MTLFLTVVLTVAVTLIALNFVTGEKKIDKKLQSLYSVSDPQFLRSMGSLLGPALRDGNRITGLSNGDQIFPQMLAAIRGAQKTITFETYIYWSGSIGTAFADALSERARGAVKVHVLLDWVGTANMDADMLKAMETSGVEVKKYHPLRWYNLARMNNRTHRKLLVVDGALGFTGGVGIADPWLGHAEDREHWRDSHYRVEGPAVAQLQAAFMDNWMKASGEVLHGDEYFPRETLPGQAVAQVFKSSPGEGSESVRLMYLLSIASARSHLRIAAAYFVPDDLSLATLVAARERGVTVEVILPGMKNDAGMTRKASRSRWGDLLRAGVLIYEYQPTLYHCKIMIVDDVWVSVGSTNFDSRSFRLNDEANLNVFDRDFADTQIQVFDADKRKSTKVSLEMWQSRPWTEKLTDRAAGLLRSQL